MVKKVKLNGGSSSSAPSTSMLASIAALEKQLSSAANADLNPLLDLLELFQSEKNSVKVRAAAANALHNIFSTLIRQGRLIGKVREQEAKNAALKAVRDWAKARWVEYTSTLCALLSSDNDALAVRILPLGFIEFGHYLT